MVIDIVVPELGESIREATVAAWLKQPGDTVAADEPVVELETDKATVELGAPKAGVLSEILVAAGEDVEIGAVLARLEEGAGAATAPSSAGAGETAAPREPEARASKLAPAPAESQSDAGAADAIDPSNIPGSGPDGQVTAADLQSALGIAPEQLGPAVRRLLDEHGLDAARIPASGKAGRITKGDVLAFLESLEAESEAGGQPPPSSALESAPAARKERVKMTRMRRTIAARLKEAQQTAAILTTFNECDMSSVIALRSKYRESFEEKHGVRLGFTSFFTKACVSALEQIPAVNAEIDGNDIVYNRFYDIGMAVSSPSGLVVPVIRNCDTKSFAQIESDLSGLAAKARDGTLTVDEMTGGTFSITNGGVFGSLLSTPILNRPQSAILGLHKIEERPIAVKGEVQIRPMMYLALSYDHRLIDGREAVTFLVKIKQAIEDPERLMLDL